jgi:outer membrane protein W
MTRSYLRATPALLLLTFLAVVLPSPAAAQDGTWTLRGGVAWVDPDVDYRVNSEGDRVRVSSDDDLGFGLAAEYQWSDRFGVELGFAWAEPDITLRLDSADLAGIDVRATDAVAFMPITAGFNVHLTPGSAADLYVGPLVAWVLYDDVTFRARVNLPTGPVSDTLELDSDDDVAFGAQIGLDVPFGASGWRVNAALSYLDTVIALEDAGDSTDVDYDPVMLRFGIGYRF